ncbi:MAG: DUF2182 domain-containing protein [Gemmatimonadaceae bacterium]
MTSPQTTGLMTVAMMVAMMLPSVAPTLWHHYFHLRANGSPRPWQNTSLFAVGYASVWSAIGLVLFAIDTVLPPVTPLALGIALLCAGALQVSRWKGRQLLRCRPTCATTARSTVRTAWQNGCRLGVACSLSCAAPMVVLLAAGLMDTRVMLLVATVITAERLAPAGGHIARLSGTLALIAGSSMVAR